MSSLRGTVCRPDQETLVVPDLWLSAPCMDLEKPFLEMVEELQATGDMQFEHALHDFPGYVRRLRGRALGVRTVSTLRDLRQRVHELLAGDSAQVDALIAAGGELASDIPKPRAGYVKRSVFWVLRQDGRMIGTGEVRHRLTPFLKFEGGHIGCVIRPSERHKGYGVRTLKLLLDQARKMGLKRILLTCDVENEPSRRLIERNGGLLENWVLSHLSRKKLRYWIVPEDERTSPSRPPEESDGATAASVKC